MLFLCISPRPAAKARGESLQVKAAEAADARVGPGAACTARGGRTGRFSLRSARWAPRAAGRRASATWGASG